MDSNPNKIVGPSREWLRYRRILGWEVWAASKLGSYDWRRRRYAHVAATLTSTSTKENRNDS